MKAMLNGVRLMAAAFVVCLIAACATPSGNTAMTPVPFVEIASGPHSGVYKRYFAVIRNRQVFANIWHRAKARQYPTPAPPGIDFSQYMVIAVFLGEKRASGHDIKITQTTRTPSGLSVTVRETRPGRLCDTSQLLTQPFEIIKVPVTDVTVAYHWQVVSDSCD